MKNLLFFWGLLLSLPIFSQEQLGLRLENYAGASSLSLNPTSQLNSPLKWDFNLIGAGLFFENNYGFIGQTNTVDLLKNLNSAEFLLAVDLEGQAPSNAYVADFFDDAQKRFFNLELYFEGPSLAFKIGEHHAVGVFTRLRSHGSSHNLPTAFSYYDYDGLGLQDPITIAPFDGAFMSWSEVGINYAFEIPTYSGNFSLGFNFKRLQGYEAGYVENFSNWEHIKLTKAVEIGTPNGRFGFTSSNLKTGGYEVVPNGSGFGFDLGATLTIDDYDDKYLWRFGASILDIGGIRFTENAEAHRIDLKSSVTINAEDYEHFKSIEEIDEILQQFSEQALGNPLASKQKDNFSLTLPSALSLQIDRSFTENVFLNATLIQRVSFGGLGPKRGNLLAFTPRFEHRWFSASLPVALYNWKAPRIGFAARLAYIVVGSDDLGSFIGKGNYTGTDIYFAVKVNPFDIGIDLFKGSGNTKRRYGKRGKVKCFDF